MRLDNDLFLYFEGTFLKNLSQIMVERASVLAEKYGGGPLGLGIHGTIFYYK